MKVECKCSFCGGVFFKYASEIKNKKNLFCNKMCKAEYQKTLVGDLNPCFGKPGKCGADNPNYGNKWTQEQKDIARNRTNEWLEDNKDEWLEINRNRSWTDEGKRAIGDAAKQRFTGKPGIQWTEEQKIQIGLKSAEKFTPEFKAKFRKTMEDRGYWTPLNERDPYSVYFKQCEWINRMFDLDYVSGIELLTEHGVFNMKTNSKGVVRDHKFGRKAGYTMKVFPEILRHPINCQIITHADNVSKAQTNRTQSNDSVITLDELFDMILQFDGDWPEQEKCVELINLYKQGKRYE